MPELWLNFTDVSGQNVRVPVNSERFMIGRHPDNNLAIADSRLSRQHARIDRSSRGFAITDMGSSNGTGLNGVPVFENAVLSNGDTIDLGGFPVRAELILETTSPSPVQPAAPAKEKDAAQHGSNTSEGRGPIPLALIFAPPFAALILVLLVGAAVYLLKPANTEIASGNDDPSNVSDSNETSNSPNDRDNNSSSGSDPKTSDQGNISVNGDDTGGNSSATPTPVELSESAKVETNAAGFLRSIAQNDPRAFLTSEQAKIVSDKVKQFKGSQALAANIESARKNATQLKTLATSKNMKPQFLAVAAITKLGNSRGDVLATAQSMADVLDKLSIQLGNELYDDCLLSIAAYDQGAAGDTMKMRNMLQDLATKFPESSRVIRSVWFLQKQGKISPTEFDRVIAFLAIGTITQNPKDFGVNTSALNL